MLRESTLCIRPHRATPHPATEHRDTDTHTEDTRTRVIVNLHSHANISFKFSHRNTGGPTNWLGSLFSNKSLCI